MARGNSIKDRGFSNACAGHHSKKRVYQYNDHTHKARKLLRTPVTFLIFMLIVLCKRICSSSSVFFTDCIPLSGYISTSC